MKSWITKLLFRVLFKAARDKALRTAVKNAVLVAVGSDKSGDEKMKDALSNVKKVAPNAFERAGKSEVKMLIEASLQDLI